MEMMEGIEISKASTDVNMEELSLTEATCSSSTSSYSDTMGRDIYDASLGLLDLPIEILQLIVSICDFGSNTILPEKSKAQADSFPASLHGSSHILRFAFNM